MKICTCENISYEMGSCQPVGCCYDCQLKACCDVVCHKAYSECEYRKDVKNERKN